MRRIAVIVCHGMGQQIAFDTMGDLATSVARVFDPTTSIERIGTTLVSDGERYLARADVPVAGAPDADTAVHFFESYWAPIVEGRVTLRDTLSFLADAAAQGIEFSLRHGEFDRFMFGRRQWFEIPARRVHEFLIAGFTLLALTGSMIALAATVAVALLFALGAGTADTPSLPWMIGLTACLLGVALVTGAVGGAFSSTFGWWLARRGTSSRARSVADAGPPVKSPASWRAASLALGSVVIAGCAVLARLLFFWALPRLGGGEPWSGWRFGASLGGLVLLLGLAYRFLVDYAGDVAAYVAPFKVSRFAEIRSAIQATGARVARHVYAARRDDGAPLYDEVYFVGHSLGSVLAYDTLNDALARDARAGGWDAASPGTRHDVAARTGLLLTVASPLDKTAFVFRTQQRDAAGELREKIVEQVQPLIQRAAYRERTRWINLWSGHDWVSGALEFYDPPSDGSGPAAAIRVRNVEQPSSLLPWRAHVGYWTRPLLPSVIAAAVLGRVPRVDADTSARVRRAFDWEEPATPE